MNTYQKMSCELGDVSFRMSENELDESGFVSFRKFGDASFRITKMSWVSFGTQMLGKRSL